jgi:hypothetical protein
MNKEKKLTDTEGISISKSGRRHKKISKTSLQQETSKKYPPFPDYHVSGY